MKINKKHVLGILFLVIASAASAYFVSLDAPQDFPINI
ncbi:hypothetical protein PALB_25000 [Pseudoalteromonas luteoviolacea B = ATCC 29581]|nr:hypothetical protein PALB_25000 [Pseudoalteromonas luteoviolacea B = ATCC 29581]